MLELMHFANELKDVDEFKRPSAAKIAKKELDMAKALIESMTEKWNPEAYKDDYREALEEMIEQKIEHGDEASPAKAPAKKKPTNVIDLVEVLQQSMREGAKKKGKGGEKEKDKGSTAKHAPVKKSGAKKRRHAKAA
jgi:DNA end-binding protein Ku